MRERLSSINRRLAITSLVLLASTLLLVAVLVTGFEAISLKGVDNLFVPLAVVFILSRITTKSLPEIVFQNLSLALIILGTALLISRIPRFNVGSTIVFILYAYGNWSLGSWHWALPVFAGLTCYVLLWALTASPDRTPRIKVRVLARALFGPFLILAFANGTGQYTTLFGPYLAAAGWTAMMWGHQILDAYWRFAGF
ncbi:MAG: hypothetical protein IH797_07230 [Chloroflexi bacterium]|nr:hypothetical protein [Chloroflexota bacterium]